MSDFQPHLDFSGTLPPEVQQRIAEGMQKADDNANYFWKRMVDAAIVAVARRLPELTVDDVLDELAKIPNCPGTHALDALGPAMRRARKDKIIVDTGKTIRSRRPEKHGNRHVVWASRYCG